MQQAWKVGVTIAMATTGTDLLQTIARSLGMGNEAAKALTHNLEGVKNAAIGAIAAFAGFKSLEFIGKIATDFDYNTERTKFALSDPGHVQQAENLAIATQSAVPTTTYSENMKAINELSGQLGSVDEVAKVLPKVMKLATVIHEMSGADMNASLVQATKFADLSGQIFTPAGPDGKEHVDAGKFAAAMETVERMSVASRGLLGPADLLAFAKQAGVEVRNMTPQAIAMMGEAMIAMGASRAGTAETSLLTQLAGGRMTQTTAREMAKVGLIGEKDITVGRGGQVLIDRAKLDDLAKRASDPAKLAGDVAAKLAADGQSQQQIMLELFRLFGRQTTQRLMAELIQGAPQMERFAQNYAAAGSTEKNYDTLLNQGAAQNVEAFTAAWKSLMEALGEAAAPVLIAVMQPMAVAIRAIAAAAAAHPNVAAVILGLAAGIAAIVTVAGTVLVAVGAFSALAGVLGAGGLAGAVSAFAAGAPALLAIGSLVGAIGAVAAALAAAGYVLHVFDKAIGNNGMPDIPEDKLSTFGKWDKRVHDRIMAALGLGPDVAPSSAPKSTMAPPPPASGKAAPSGSADDPIHTRTTIANPRDLARGVTAGQARDAARPSAGTTGPDPRFTPDLSLSGAGY